MYTKTSFIDGHEITDYYESWYEILWDGLITGSVYVFFGLVQLVVTPFFAVYSIWTPRLIRSESLYPLPHHEK